MPAVRLLASAAVALCGHAAANESADAVLPRLRQGGEVSCQPALPHFCANVHVKCVGQTSVATFPFQLRGAARSHAVELVTAAEDFQNRYRNAGVEWDKDGGYVLIEPRGAKGFLKLLADGKYVFRHYVQDAGVMSLGSCR